MPIGSKLLTAVTGDPIKREIKRHQAMVDAVKALEDELAQLSDAQLRGKTAEFRERLGVTGPDLSHGQSSAVHSGERLAGGDDEELEAEQERREEEEALKERQAALDAMLPEAFAVVREAAKRTLGMRPFDVQLIGGAVLHQ